jgi:isopentenyl-diphosphate delta-isomerase
LSTETSKTHWPGGESAARAPVSFHDEQLVLVDSADQPVGYCSKDEAHRGAGQLHRAFSVFLFDGKQRLMIHRRSAQKPLWPGYWTNSCCSHPRRGETLVDAVHRRVREELGVAADLQSIYSFEYHASFADQGSEHELCHVYLARLRGDDQVVVHEDEISEWRWVSLDEVDAMQQENKRELTPWFQMEWRALRTRYSAELHRFVATLEQPRDVA